MKDLEVTEDRLELMSEAVELDPQDVEEPQEPWEVEHADGE